MRGSRKKYQSTVGVVNVWGGKIKVASEIIYIAGSVPQSGTLAANGQLISRVSYANLFAAIGTTYGAGDGVNTFQVPDLRGEFARGVDNGRGVDTGRVLGSSQSGSTIVQQRRDTGYGGAAWTDDSLISDGDSPVMSTPANGGLLTMEGGATGANVRINTSKARPRNIALLACIQY